MYDVGPRKLAATLRHWLVIAAVMLAAVVTATFIGWAVLLLVLLMPIAFAFYVARAMLRSTLAALLRALTSVRRSS